MTAEPPTRSPGRPPDSCLEGTSDCHDLPAIWYDDFRDLTVELARIDEELERRVFPSRHGSPAFFPLFPLGHGTKGGPATGSAPTRAEIEEPARNRADARGRAGGRQGARPGARARRARSDDRRHGRRGDRRLPGTRCSAPVPGLPEHRQGETAVPGRHLCQRQPSRRAWHSQSPPAEGWRHRLHRHGLQDRELVRRLGRVWPSARFPPTSRSCST